MKQGLQLLAYFSKAPHPVTQRQESLQGTWGPKSFGAPWKIHTPHHLMPHLGPHISGTLFLWFLVCHLCSPSADSPFQGPVFCRALSSAQQFCIGNKNFQHSQALNIHQMVNMCLLSQSCVYLAINIHWIVKESLYAFCILGAKLLGESDVS